ncbi:MAG: glutamate--tRNA ligase [Myxococcales bacterium]|nr:glutamate--tRNA ligase [Myxococcales bacterium]
MGIVTRFPPSPTGDLHIGGARTALFNWAFARHHEGQFVLRFEDTDRARSSRASEAAMLEALDWLGLGFDPAPGPDPIPRQSERLEHYRAAVEKLLAAGHAYRCICTPEEVEAMRERARAEGRNPAYDRSCRNRSIGADEPRPWCVRLRIPEDGQARWIDLIAGPSGQELAELDDFVLARTDGTPVYHLAVVVDDHEMGISHVIRGREHMTSTSRQLLLYQALELEPPRFAHVPLLVDASGRKLSKRQASVSVQSYRERGFPPEAVLNFLARLGWGSGDLEVFDARELVRRFTLEGVGRSPAGIDEDKLLWLSQQYIKSLPAETLRRYARPFLEREAGGPVEFDAALVRLLELLRERSRTFEEMAQRARFYLHDPVEFEPKAARKHLKPAAREVLADLRSTLAELSNWTDAGLEAAIHEVLARRELPLGKLAQPVRVAVTGSAASPGIFETLCVLGSARSLVRIDAALAYIDAHA